jgi:hypothetical protein
MMQGVKMLQTIMAVDRWRIIDTSTYCGVGKRMPCIKIVVGDKCIFFPIRPLGADWEDIFDWFKA